MTKIHLETSEQLGRLIRNVRKDIGLTQKQAAAFCNVGVRFISDLENGKPTAHIGKALHVLYRLGINLYAEEATVNFGSTPFQPKTTVNYSDTRQSEEHMGIAEYNDSLESYLGNRDK